LQGDIRIVCSRGASRGPPDPLHKVCLCMCVKTARFLTDEKPFFEAAADGPVRKMTRLRLRARLRAPRKVEARAPDPPLPPGRGRGGRTAKMGEADEQPPFGRSGQKRSRRKGEEEEEEGGRGRWLRWACGPRGLLVRPGRSSTPPRPSRRGAPRRAPGSRRCRQRSRGPPRPRGAAARLRRPPRRRRAGPRPAGT